MWELLHISGLQENTSRKAFPSSFCSGVRVWVGKPLTNPAHLCRVFWACQEGAHHIPYHTAVHPSWICPRNWITLHPLVLTWANQSCSCFFAWCLLFGLEIWIHVLLSPLSVWPVAQNLCLFHRKKKNKPNKLTQHSKKQPRSGELVKWVCTKLSIKWNSSFPGGIDQRKIII